MDTHPSTPINILFRLPNIIAASGASVLFGPLLVSERVRKEKNDAILLRNISSLLHPFYTPAGLLKYDLSGAVSGQVTASQSQQRGIGFCLKSHCVQVFLQVLEKYILLMADFKRPQ